MPSFFTAFVIGPLSRSCTSQPKSYYSSSVKSCKGKGERAGGVSRSRGPAVSGYGQGRKDRSPTAAVEAHPAPAPETSAPPARGGGAQMGGGNRSKEEVGGVAKPAPELFAVLPRQTERPHVGHPQAR